MSKFSTQGYTFMSEFSTQGYTFMSEFEMNRPRLINATC